MEETTKKEGESAPSPGPSESPSTAAKTVVVGADSNAALKVGDLNKRQMRTRNPRQSLLNVFLPNRVLSPGTMQMIAGIELFLFLLVWIFSPYKVLPQPGEVFHALQKLWMTQGLGQDLMTSFLLNLEAIGLTALISLALSYLTVIPIFRPLVAGISRGRFLSLVGFTLVFTLMFGGGRPLKVSLLVFAMTVFYVTSMASVIAQIPKEAFDHARTLRMSEWRVVWEIVILGTVDKAFEVLRQNAAIGWMMLTMVEGIVRGEGGIATALLNQNKYLLMPEVFAIQILILFVGLLQDYAIGVTRRVFCPYADLTLERK